MFEDDELVALFKIESEERLQNLDQGLLRLEANPRDTAILDALFREAHNLKGAARMVGAVDVGTVAHRFEDILGEARRGATTLSAELIDGLCSGLDGMRHLVTQVIEGKPAGVAVEEILAVLSGQTPAPIREPSGAAEVKTSADAVATPPRDTVSPSPATEPRRTNGTRPAPMLAEAPPEARALRGEKSNGAAAPPGASTPDAPLRDELSEAPAPATSPHSENTEAEEPGAGVADGLVSPAMAAFRIETIRVEPQKLDALMNHAGELTVTKSRIARRLDELEQLVTFQEEWAREAPRPYGAGPDHALPHGRTADRFSRLDRLGGMLARLQAAAAEDVARLEFVADQLEDGIRNIRLLPLSTIFNLFPRMVRDLSREQGKGVQLVVEGGDIAADKRIIEELKDPLMHVLRNAVDHGIESLEERRRAGKPPEALLRLRAVQTATNVVIEVEDDGRGIDLEAVRRTALKRRVRTEEELAAMSAREIRELIFAPGFSTRSAVTDVSGRGVGLDVVRKNVDHLKGFLEVESEPGSGCRLRISLPLTLATSRVLIVAAAGQTFALPIGHVESARHVSRAEIFPIKGCDTILVDGCPVTLIPLARLLQLPEPDTAVQDVVSHGRPERPLTCILLKMGKDRLGLLVDDLLDEQEIVLKQLGAMLMRVPNIAGATILGTGEVCMVLNSGDLLKSARKCTSHPREVSRPEAAERKPVVLIVEDSITTRTQEKRILEGAGYEVVTAVDGVDGFNKLRSRSFDAVISDIEMPNMDGLNLTAKIRQDASYRELPIILLTSLASDESRRRGVDAGANAYLLKSTFDQAELLDTLRRLL